MLVLESIRSILAIDGLIKPVGHCNKRTSGSEKVVLAHTRQRSMKCRLKMTSLPAKMIAIKKIGDQYQVVVQINTRYRGSFNALAFGEIKPYSGIPRSTFGDPFPLWTLR